MSVEMVNGNNYTVEEIANNPFFELSDELLCIIDDRGNFQCVNPSGEKTLGFSQGELKDKPFIQFVHPEEQAIACQHLEQLQAGIGAIAFESRYQCKDGSYKQFSWKLTTKHKEKITYAIARELHPPAALPSPTVTACDDLQSFFERSQELFCILGFDTYFKSLNPAWENTLGFTLSELRSQSFIEFVYPQDHQSTLSEFVKLIQGPTTRFFENRYLCKNGGYRWLLWAATPAFDRQSIYAVAHDITERKQAQIEVEQAYEETRQFVSQLEMKLQSRSLAFNSAIHKLQNEIGERRIIEESLTKEREFLKALLNTVDAGILACDANGVVTLFNRSTREFYGLPEEPISPSEWSNYYDLYLRDGKTPMPQEQMPLFRALNGEVVRKEEMAIAPKHGEQRIVIASGEAIFDETGNKLGAVIALHDITESKRKAEALQQSAREKTELIRSLQEQAQQLKQTLQELQRTQTQLIQSEKMSSLGQLVAGVAHEINNPVNFIYGNLAHANDYLGDLLQLLNLYQKHYPNPVPEICEIQDEIDLDFLQMDLPKLLSSMKVGAERIRQIVVSLRNFSRLNEAELKQVDIHEGIENTLLILHNRFKEKGRRCAIRLVKDYNKLPRVECYPAQLNQAIINIVTNALEALESEKSQDTESKGTGEQEKVLPTVNSTSHIPTIRICTEVVDERWVTIRIKDNGLGMSSQVKSQIFNPFFTTKPVGKGTGLGLSIAYQIIVHKHSGILSCESEIGEGTEFLIRLPIYQHKT